MGNPVAGRITVALVEDNVDFAHTVRDFLAGEPDFELLDLSHDEAGFQGLVQKHLPEIALVDLGLSRSDSGVDLLQWLLREYPVVRAVVMTANVDEVMRCYELGIRGYILKSRLETLAETLRQVRDGHLIIPQDVGEILVRQMSDQSRKLRKSLAISHLSEREKEILALLCRGLTREQISEKLEISYFTVRRHLQNTLEKTGISSLRTLLEAYGEVLGGTVPLRGV